MVLVFFTGLAFAGTVDLPKTGQTKCYNRGGQKIPCIGTGQDGDIQAGVPWPDPRFTDNGNVAMTDNLTGLTWTKNANLPNAELNWQEALDFCNNLTFAGYSDWRLPNVIELESLFNAGEPDNAAWLSTQGFTNAGNQHPYWSSTTYANIPERALVYTSVGDIWHPLDDKSEGYFYVWPVRGGQCGLICLPRTGQTKCYSISGAGISCAGTGQDGDIQAGVAWSEPRFTDYGDGTVTDNFTGLMWTKDADLTNGMKVWMFLDLNGQVTWQQAFNFIAGMNAGIYENFGYTDWRLPNRKELLSLTDYSQISPGLPAGHPFMNFNWDYWSSTYYASSLDEAWVVSIGMGVDHIWKHFYWDPDMYAGGLPTEYVWPVRGGQVGPSDQ
jgi:hypothetical protein